MEQKTFIKVYADDIGRYKYIKAIILGLIQGWCEYHEKIGNKQSDGNYWSGHLSYRDISEQTSIPYDTVVTNLKSLVEDGIVQKGQFNKKSYDITSWYRRVDLWSGILPPMVGETTPYSIPDHTPLSGIPHPMVGETITIPYIPLQSSLESKENQEESENMRTREIEEYFRKIYEQSNVNIILEDEDTSIEKRIDYSKKLLEELETLNESQDRYWHLLAGRETALKLINQ